MNGLKVLRQVEGLDQLFVNSLLGDDRLIEFDDGKQYIDNDLAYDAVVTNEVMKHTVGFIITDAQYGKIPGTPTYRALDKAEAARSGAKVQVVSVVEDVAVEDEPADNAPAEPAAASVGGGALASA